MSDVTLWHRQIHVDDREHALSADEQCRVTGTYQAEYRLITKDGRTVWCRDEGRAVLDREGQPSYLQGVIFDITGRKNAEERLRQSEERFRQLAETIKEVFWLSDPSKKEMIYISPGYESIWGRCCEDLYRNPRGWMEVIHPDDFDRVVQSATTRQTTGEYDEEYRIVRPDGAIRWIRDRAFPVRDARGQVYRIAGIAEDITHRRSIEDALRDADDHVMAQFLFEAVAIAVSGGLVGLTAATLIVLGVSQIPAEGNQAMLYILRPVVSWPIVILCVSTLVAVGLLAGFLPARRSAAVDPVESLRYE